MSSSEVLLRPTRHLTDAKYTRSSKNFTQKQKLVLCAPDVRDLRQRSTLPQFLITEQRKQRSATELEEIPADYLSNWK